MEQKISLLLASMLVVTIFTIGFTVGIIYSIYHEFKNKK